MYDLDPSVSAWDDSTFVYKIGSNATFNDWTISGNGELRSDDTSAAWSGRGQPPWDFDQGVFAEIKMKDYESVVTTLTMRFRFLCPLSRDYRQVPDSASG